MQIYKLSTAMILLAATCIAAVSIACILCSTHINLIICSAIHAVFSRGLSFSSSVSQSPIQSVINAGTGHLGAGTFGHQCLGEQKPWCITVIKCICYFSKALVSSIKLLFEAAPFSSTEHLHVCIKIHCFNPAAISIKEGLFSSMQHTFRNNSLHFFER